MARVEAIHARSKFTKIIYLDDGSFFKISNKANARYKLKVNQNIDEFDDLLKYFIYPAIRYKLNDLLKRKDYSEKELLDKLYLYGYSCEFVQPVIDEFKKLRFIDDENYCNELIYRYSKKYGYHMIKRKILSKGIDASIFDKCYESFISENEDSHISPISDLLKNYSKEELSDFKTKRKIKNRLIYRGFSFDEIDDMINAIINEDEMY